MTTSRRQRTRRDTIILWVAAPLGVLLLVLTWFGNALGLTILPFDQHHIVGQVGGFALLIYGLTHWH